MNLIGLTLSISSMGCFYTDYMPQNFIHKIIDLRVEVRKDMRKLKIVKIFKLENEKKMWL